MNRKQAAAAFLGGMTAAFLFLSYMLLAPFLKPILFAAISALMFYPLHTRFLRWTGRRNAAAVLSTITVILCASALLFFLGSTVYSGLTAIYHSLNAPTDGKEFLAAYILRILERASGFLGRYLPVSLPNLQQAVSDQVENAISRLLAMGAGLLGGATSLLGDALVSFFVLFFLFRDGRRMLRRAIVILPMKRSQVRRLYALLAGTLHAILYGTLAIAALQGALTGLGFYILGVTSAALWGIVASICALLPVIGTAFVFVPAISMLAFNGHMVKAVIMLLWALLIVNPVDNILRPLVIGGRTKLSTLFVSIALLGGVSAFGALGIFLGPWILAITAALLTFLREEKRTAKWSWAADLAGGRGERKQPVSTG